MNLEELETRVRKLYERATAPLVGIVALAADVLARGIDESTELLALRAAYIEALTEVERAKAAFAQTELCEDPWASTCRCARCKARIALERAREEVDDAGARILLHVRVVARRRG